VSGITGRLGSHDSHLAKLQLGGPGVHRRGLVLTPVTEFGPLWLHPIGSLPGTYPGCFPGNSTYPGRGNDLSLTPYEPTPLVLVAVAA
jgi:hypothetical protein